MTLPAEGTGSTPPAATPPASGDPPSSSGEGNEFLSQLPEDLRGHASLASIKDLPSLAKSYVSAQELVGRKGVLLPRENATQEELDYFHSQIGRPESPDKYHFVKENEQAPYPDEMIDWFRKEAFKHGLSQKAAKGLLESYAMLDQQLLAKANETLKTEHEKKSKEVEAQMRQEWGAAYDEKLNRGRMVAEKFATPEMVEKLRAAIGAPELMRIFAKIGDSLSEDTLRSRPSPSSTPMTPAEAQMEINNIKANKEHPLNEAYWNRRNPNHDAAVERMSELFRFLHPERTQEA